MQTIRDALLEVLRQPMLDVPTGERVTGHEALRRAIKRKVDSGDAEALELYKSVGAWNRQSDVEPPTTPPEPI